jgi:Predicted membrane-associated Zn-dependent proteases 1
MDIIEGKADLDRARLPKISALDKIIVAIAGPVFSLLLALFFAGIVWAVGHPVSEGDSTTVVGYVMPGSPAEKAGCNRAIKSCPWMANRSGVSWE